MEEKDDKTIDIVQDTMEVKKNEQIFTNIQDITLPQQSPNFVYGVSGWRLNSNGVIDAVGVNLAGTIVPDGVIAVIYGGTGAQTLSGIIKGNGTSAFTAITPLAGSGSFYVAATSGGSPTVKIDYTDGIITART